MKTTIEIIPEVMKWQATFQLDGGEEMILRGESVLPERAPDKTVERTAVCYRDASWALTAGVLHELGKRL